MTTDLPELTIFDVGHGNCAMLDDDGAVMVIDVPQHSRELLETLADESIEEIDAILISHADTDHVAGVAALLTDENMNVRRLFVNPDAPRRTRAWESVRIAVRDRKRRRPEFEAHTQLTTSSNSALTLPNLEVQVLAPAPDFAMSGSGGTTIDGSPISSNGMSAVVRVSRNGEKGILFTGDLDRTGLDELLDAGTDLSAEVLVFPHHGGLPGGSEAREFAARLTEAVGPEVVVFSLRGDQQNPRPEIVIGIREVAPNAHIACTQLSGQCASQHPNTSQDYLSRKPARGRSGSDGPACCAGTLDFFFSPSKLQCPQLQGHAEWVYENVPGRICATTAGGGDAAADSALA